jgi:hypothetical protein
MFTLRLRAPKLAQWSKVRKTADWSSWPHNYCLLREGTVLFGVLAGRGPGRVARGCLEPSAQFAGNEKFSSPLGPTPVDRWPTAGEGCKMWWTSSHAGGHGTNSFRYIITSDESWFHFECQHASQRSVSRDEIPQKADLAIGTVKFMLTAIWGVNGFHLLDLVSSQCRFNAQYFVEHVLPSLIQRVFSQGRVRHTPSLNVHLDNCRVHFSRVTEQFFIDNHLLYVLHLPYSPDLARQASGYSGVSRLDSPAEASPSPKSY